MAVHAEAAPRAGAPRRQLVAVAAGSGRQRGCWWRAWEGVGETSETQPSLILIRMSRPRISMLRLAARSCGKQPLRAGVAAIAASEGRPQASDARMPQGCFQSCASEGPVLKYRLNFRALR